MIFAEFTRLNKEQKVDAVWEWGFFLGKCKNSEQNRILYSLNGYFAEMWLNTNNGEVIDVFPVNELDAVRIADFSLSKDNPFVIAAAFQDQAL